MTLPAAAFLALLLAPPPTQQMHRWRDSAGIEHVTTTPPPPGTTPLDLPDGNPASIGGFPSIPSPQDVARQERAALETTLSEPQKVFWLDIEARIRRARSAGDLQALQRTADDVLLDALLGQGLWAALGLPIILVAMGLLAGWWLGSGRRRALAALSLTLGFLGGMVLSHVLTARVVYRAQSQRLRLSLTLLPHFLGPGVLPGEAHRRLLLQHIQNLETASRPVAPPWAFPREVLAIHGNLRRVIANP